MAIRFHSQTVLALAAVFCCVFPACSGDLASPEATFRTFIRIIDDYSRSPATCNAECDGIMNVLFERVGTVISSDFIQARPGNEQYINVMSMYWVYGMYAGTTQFGHFTSVEVTDVVYEDDTHAVVKAVLHTDHPSRAVIRAEIDMVEEDDGWKILPRTDNPATHCVRLFEIVN